IQRTLAAKSLEESQKGIIFAGFLKLLIPLLVVIPGIIVYVLFHQTEGTAHMSGIVEAFTNANGSIDYDNSYQWLMTTFLAIGILGLDRKRTRLNSSHVSISYAVFCLKKKH